MQEMSLILCEALAEDDWDVIHFPDTGGLGAATLLLRAAAAGVPEYPDSGDRARADRLASGWQPYAVERR